ncbi:MAG TPA: GNAT family N-acetyltransferase [Acidimicrobiales bacterium]
MTGPFIIREATTGDLDGILNLKKQITGLTQIREREIVDAATAAHDCLVSTDGSERVIGYVVLSQEAFFGRDLVRLLEVSDRHRRLGVATALLASALARCTTKTVFISTNESNVVMRSLLAHDGWTFSGTLTGLDDGDPEFVFWKEPIDSTK